MKRGRLITLLAALTLAVGAGRDLGAQQPDPAQQPPVASFKASVDLVRITAIVRDHKGRFVQDLNARDFEILDEGHSRAIADFRADVAGVSVAMLFDVSGSMNGKMPTAQEAATHLLSWLDADKDEAAVFTFDTLLQEVMPFTIGVKALPESLSHVVPFGETSLHDAIAATAQRVGKREGRRRAVVVFTDGADTSSRLKPSIVSAIASEIDVPVYIIGVVSMIENSADDTKTNSTGRAALTGDLADLAQWTGGHSFLVSTPAQRSIAARQIIEELRHQYLLAFEPSGRPGWHPLVVRARNKDLVVRTRSGYVAGQSSPTSY
jgi:Ca-activated chloride channel homolog